MGTQHPKDPGQAGAAQRDDHAAWLVGRDVRFSPETSSNDVRAKPLAEQTEVGNVKLLRAGGPARDASIEPFLDELCLFPSGHYKDQIDAAS